MICEHCLGEFSVKPRGPRTPRFCSAHCQNRQWGENNPDRQRELWRAAYSRNPDAKKQRVKKYAAEHPEVNNRAAKKYAQTDKGRVAGIKRTKVHRARRLGATGNHTTGEFLQVVNRFDNKCLRCGETFDQLTEDHVVPLSRGGSDSISNIQPLCHPCNSAKRDKTIDYRPKDIGYHPMLGQSVIASVSGGMAPQCGPRAVPCDTETLQLKGKGKCP